MHIQFIETHRNIINLFCYIRSYFELVWLCAQIAEKRKQFETREMFLANFVANVVVFFFLLVGNIFCQLSVGSNGISKGKLMVGNSISILDNNNGFFWKHFPEICRVHAFKCTWDFVSGDESPSASIGLMYVNTRTRTHVYTMLLKPKTILNEFSNWFLCFYLVCVFLNPFEVVFNWHLP